MSRKIAQFLMLAALVAVTSVAMADPPARVGRVTVTEGRVTMLVNGEEEAGNLMNWPVTSENHLTTASGARAEFRVGSAAIRLDGDSDLEVQELDDERLVLRLNYGTAAVRLRDPAMLNEFEFLTPQARVTLAEPGSFRVDAERAPDTTVINVFAGNARVEGAGTMLTARTGKRVEVRGDDIFTALARRDDFDNWVAGRDRRDEGMVASRYVPADMTGYEDLDNYGNWVEDREYGTVWFPRAVSAGWAPYRDGRWVWISPWGWTWVDNSPWGYAPFHYGRWVVVGGRWCWTPGRVVGRSVWSPALVGWVGGNNWSVSFGSGRSGPAVGWYPLSPRDRYVPAYRMSSDFERRLVWNHRTNERWHERYQDRDHDGRRDGVTALPSDQWGRGRHIPVNNGARVTPQDVRNVPLMTAPPVLSSSLQRQTQAQPPRQDWQHNREDRFNRDRDERFNRDRGQDRHAERERGPDLRVPDRQDQQRQPVLQTQPQPQQPQQPRQNWTRTDNDERDGWRNRIMRTQQQQQQQQQQQPQLQAAPPQAQPQPQPQRMEQPRHEPRFGGGEREERGRRDAPQVQMAPARPAQMSPPPQPAAPQPAAPQPQPQPQMQPQQSQPQQQHQQQQRREARERREERMENGENRR
ncbi:DUF6600 domain-containing protein [Duganella sp. Root336D2]|uniref:DUF6600 domain-containing protein n=1 Tax=Duganella sp. Root336D2 TaxID=1736518 RepID=UPI0006FBF12B|nr:DUF6600 domain-containing protein [Duganella sp. Root336D2]KQV43088.1 hypothetical protein ASD07_21895 [Duganella sp. Root336D2]